MENPLCFAYRGYCLSLIHILIGGKRGISASVGLVFTFVCILFLYVPLMYIGIDPFGAATLTAVIAVSYTHLAGQAADPHAVAGEGIPFR